MVISIIVAMDENRGIGIDDRLPWRLSDDLKRFKRLTMGHHLIMGRKTYASIGHPLPGRDIIILTRNPQFEAEGCQTASTLADAIQIAASRGEDEIFVCGGAEVYAQALPIADRIYLTQVHAKTSANVHFPPLGTQTWSEKSS
ncbi:MAG: dihydrofolate reductase, partial [Chloroflexota bacterium]|nr:dihydrofolate reductase [Chloroflexota bacterium]